MTIFQEISFDKLNHLQIGRIGEYYVKLCLTLAGLDTYSSDVDDKGIDFVIRLDNNKHVDVQVKALRLENTKYAFIKKASWKHKIYDNTWLALLLLKNGQIPDLYLIPSTVWEKPNDLFIDRPYGKPEQKSDPEWGINLSNKNLHLLAPFIFKDQLKNLRTST